MSSPAAHVFDLVHALGVLLDEVHLVREGAVNRLHLVADVVLLGVVVLEVRHAADVASRF